MQKKLIEDIPTQLKKAVEVDQLMGSPLDPANQFSFARAVYEDEAEKYPEEALQCLYQMELQEYLIPKSYGGSQDSFEEVGYIIRMIARRDPTLALSFSMPYLGVVPIWISGNENQIAEAKDILKEGGRISLGLTEKEHGSDILSNELLVTSTPDGYVLNGSKWLINHISKGQAINCYSRIPGKSGPRAYSFIFVIKKNIDPKTYSITPKIHTLGMRGADMGGITFSESLVAKESLVGREGDGLEIMLKGFYITRMMAPCIPLGAMDTAFRTTMHFALDRKLYGKAVFEIPHAKETFVRVFLNLLLADACSLFGLKVLNVCPEKACLYSSMVKSFIPSILESSLHDLSVILGARYYLRDEYFNGIFQKIARDIPVVRFGDGNTLVNLQSLLFHTKEVYRKQHFPQDANIVDKVFDIYQSTKPLDYKALSLGFKGSELINYSWELKKNEIFSSTNDPEFVSLLKKLDDEYCTVIQNLKEREGCPGYEEPYAYFKIGERWCLLSSLVCLLLFRHHSILDDFLKSEAWLKLILQMHIEPHIPFSRIHVENVAKEIKKRQEDHLLYSLHPIPVQTDF